VSESQVVAVLGGSLLIIFGVFWILFRRRIAESGSPSTAPFGIPGIAAAVGVFLLIAGVAVVILGATGVLDKI
jgi:hypothetical protein